MSEARILDVTATEYHSDPLPSPSLSSSIAHTLISQSAKHAWLRHPKLGGHARKPTSEMDTGTLAHALLLDAGRDVHVIDARDYKTNAAKAQKQHALDHGRVPVLTGDLAEAEQVVAELRRGLKEVDVEFSGKSEVAIAWEEHPTPRDTVLCRGLLDHLILNEGTIYDLKTIRSAHPKTCAKHMVDYGYAIQWAAYTSAIEKLRPELAGRTDFVFLFVEVEPPFCITPVRPSGTMRQLGQAQWDRAVETWSQCLKWNKWPGYTTGIIEVDAPPWAITAELGSAA